MSYFLNIKPVYEGIPNIFYKFATATDGGLAVTIDTAAPGFVKVVAAATDPVFGLLAQNVIPVNQDVHILDSVTLVARVGQNVGVYTGAGHYLTTKVKAGVAAGDKLWAEPVTGLLTNAAPSGSIRPIALAETATNAVTQTMMLNTTASFTRIYFFGQNV